MTMLVFGVFLVHIFPHSDWIWKDTPYSVRMQENTDQKNNKYRHFSRSVPANVRLDEDVLKTSFVFVFRRRLQDVLVKTNIFVLGICLQDVFKTFSRRLAKTSSRRLQNVFKTSWKTSSSTKTMYQFEVKQQVSEVVGRRFLKISRTTQENICVWISWPATLLKRDFNTGVFLWNLQNF